MAEKTPKPIAYNQDYVIGPQLIGKPSDQVVFLYFWNMYCTKLRYKQSPYVKVNVSRIHEQRNLDEKTIKKSIAHLQDIGLLSVDDDDMCLVNGGRYAGLVKAFNELEDGDKVDRFIKAVDEHDDSTLKRLGFGGDCVIAEVLEELKGSPIGYDTEQSQNPGKIPTEPEKSQLDRIFTDNPGIIPTALYNSVAICKNTELTGKIPDVLQKCVQTIINDLGELRSIVASESNPGNLLVSLENYLAIREKSQIDGQKSGKNPEQKINNINKDEINDGMPSASYIGGENDLKDKKVEELPSDEFKNIDMAGYSQAKLKSQLPLYTSQEIQEILNNPQEAITSNDKLFIRVLWNIAKEQAALDYDDQEIEVDVEGYKFPAERFQRDILSPALEETNEIIEQGLLSTGKENLPVELEELQPDQVSLIIDWETGKDSEGSYIVGSTSRFHKIYSEAVESPRRKRGRGNAEERDKAKAYFRYILKCTEDEYDQLSDIEAAIYNFAHDFLEVDYDEGEVIGLRDSEDLQQKFISPERYTAFIASLSESGINITKEDFESVLNQAERSMTGSLEHIGETMYSIFSYEKIQAWIKKHPVTNIKD